MTCISDISEEVAIHIEHLLKWPRALHARSVKRTKYAGWIQKLIQCVVASFNVQYFLLLHFLCFASRMVTQVCSALLPVLRWCAQGEGWSRACRWLGRICEGERERGGVTMTGVGLQTPRPPCHHDLCSCRLAEALVQCRLRGRGSNLAADFHIFSQLLH